MNIIIGIILLLLLIITTFLKGKSRTLSVAMLSYMWILLWGNIENPDLENYQFLYEYVGLNGIGFQTSQIGLIFIIKIALYFGLSYTQFLALFSSIALFLIYITVEKHSKKPQIVYVLYFIYPFLLDLIQIKHFLAMSLVIFSINFLLKKTKKDLLIFFVIIAVASSIHIISIVFIFIPFVINMSEYKLIKTISIWVLIATPFAYTNIFLNILILFVPSERIAHYFENRAEFGFLIQYFIQLSLLAGVFYSKKYLTKIGIVNQLDMIIYKLNIYLIGLFPFYIVNGTFERGFRIIMIFNFIIFSNVYFSLPRKSKVISLMVIIIFGLLLSVYYLVLSPDEDIISPIFKNNIFFESII
ncbi:hypothetical protein CQS04_07130 [Chryseomicrobium excrementi]|uniref:EpsG family protein n=1 Tax=Chryseomicrobium excrementi TaxID=2041346 RepID=A0A2M9F0E0_9BACL|nr:EpsG family protein [Chryseomicrobium excrementi]PJK16919.1 hypothetical protein CQS04_07130 [Chryseomicrobium excrementi]